jgi:hypothetical protein
MKKIIKSILNKRAHKKLIAVFMAALMILLIVLTIDSAVFTRNGTSHSLDVPAQSIGDGTMIPTRPSIESIGYNVESNGQTGNISINTEEVKRIVYRDNVIAIDGQLDYSFVEANDILTITINNPNDAIRQLKAGDTFVLEPTDKQPQRMAGRVTEIRHLTPQTIIRARIPDNITDIFAEYEFKSEFNVLEHADDITLAEGLEEIEGITIWRNPTRVVGVIFDGATFDETFLIDNQRKNLATNYRIYDEQRSRRARLEAGVSVTIDGTINLEEIQAIVSIEIQRSWNGDEVFDVERLLIDLEADWNITVKTTGYIETDILLCTMRAQKFGTGLEIPIFLRLATDGSAVLVYDFGAHINAGIVENEPHFAQNVRKDEYSLNLTGSLSAAIVPQLSATIVFAHVYGVELRIGMGAQVAAGMQQECSTFGTSDRCHVIQRYIILEVATIRERLGQFDALHISKSFAPAPTINDYRFITFDPFRFEISCIHTAGQTAEQTPSPTIPTTLERPHLFGNGMDRALRYGDVTIGGQTYTESVYTVDRTMRTTTFTESVFAEFFRGDYDVFKYGVAAIGAGGGMNSAIRIYLDGVRVSEHFLSVRNNSQPEFYELDISYAEEIRIEFERVGGPNVAIFDMWIGWYE